MSGKPETPLIYVEGGWIPADWLPEVATVPWQAGMEAVVRFARSCLEANVKLERALIECLAHHPRPNGDHP